MENNRFIAAFNEVESFFNIERISRNDIRDFSKNDRRIDTKFYTNIQYISGYYVYYND